MKVGFGGMDTGGVSKANYRSVIHKINPYDILEYYGAENLRPEDSNHEVVHSCLIDRVDPHHKNGDQSPSAAFNTDKMLYSCYSYGGGDVFWLLMKMEGTDWRGIAPLVSKFTQEGYDDQERFETVLKRMFEDESPHLALPKYNDRILKGWQLHHPYLLEDRGFSQEVLEEYGVGYDPKGVHIIIPHYWRGDLVGWQKRRLDSPEYPKTPPMFIKEKGEYRQAPKYQNTEAFPRDSTLYGWDLADKNKTVVVVESAASVWAGRQLGLNMVATFGAKVHDKQLRLLREFPEVVWFTDGDLPGLQSALKNVKALQDHVWTRLVIPPLDKDFDDCRSEALGLVEAAPPAFLVWEDLKKRVKELQDAHP